MYSYINKDHTFDKPEVSNPRAGPTSKHDKMFKYWQNRGAAKICGENSTKFRSTNVWETSLVETDHPYSKSKSEMMY